MQRDADGDQFFGFCGMRVYVPDDDPHAESIAEGVLRRFRERLAEGLAGSPEKRQNVGTTWKLSRNRRSPATAN